MRPRISELSNSSQRRLSQRIPGPGGPVGGTAIFNVLANYIYGGTAPSTLSGGAALLPGQYMLSPAHAYQLLYQGDGNLVIYRGDGVALWSSGTEGSQRDT